MGLLIVFSWFALRLRYTLKGSTSFLDMWNDRDADDEEMFIIRISLAQRNWNIAEICDANIIAVMMLMLKAWRPFFNNKIPTGSLSTEIYWCLYDYLENDEETILDLILNLSEYLKIVENLSLNIIMDTI